MRNLKKVLSLALALVMLLGMMVVGAGAKTSFKDDDEIKNQVAVAVANKIGVLLGDDSTGNFNPGNTLTRAEAAVAVAKLDLGATAAEALTATDASTFKDVPASHWGKAYIDYCAGRGYIVGDGNGNFNPSGKVKNVEFGLMVARMLGYQDKNEDLGGADWIVKASALARKAGLGENVPLDNAPMTRDGMAQMVFNALKAPLVEYEGLNVSIGDVSLTSQAKIRTHTGSSLGSVANTTYDGQRIQANITPIRLCEEKFPDLKLTSDKYDAFGRPQSVWTWKKVSIAGSEQTYADDANSHTDDAVDTKAVINSATTTFENGKQVANPAKLSNLAANGRLVQVYYWDNDQSSIYRITAIDTFVARVVSVNSDKGTVTVTPLSGHTPEDKPALLNKTFKTTGFSAGDIVTYKAAWNKTDGKYDIKEMTALTDPVTGTLTAWRGTNVIVAGEKGGDKKDFTVEGNTYEYSFANYVADMEGNRQDSGVAGFAVNKDQVNVYVDEYGFAIYVSGVEAEKNYAAVIGVGSSNTHGSQTVGVTLLFPDNTTKEVTAKVKNVATGRNTTTALSTKMAAESGKSRTDAQLVNDPIADVVSYRVDDNGVYELTLLGYISTDTASQAGKYTGKYWTNDGASGRYDTPNTENDSDLGKITGARDNSANTGASFTNGKSEFKVGSKTLYANSKTIFMVCTDDGRNGYNYNVYTGYQEMPSLLTDVGITGIAYGTRSIYSNQLDIVYIYAQSVSGMTASNTFFVVEKNQTIYTDSTGSYMVVNAVVDGEETTVKVSTDCTPSVTANKVAKPGLYRATNVIKNRNDIITSFSNAPMTFGIGTVKADRVVMGVGTSEASANYFAYNEKTRVILVSEDFKSISVVPMDSVLTDKNDEVWYSFTDNANKVLKDVVIWEQADPTYSGVDTITIEGLAVTFTTGTQANPGKVTEIKYDSTKFDTTPTQTQIENQIIAKMEGDGWTYTGKDNGGTSHDKNVLCFEMDGRRPAYVLAYEATTGDNSAAPIEVTTVTTSAQAQAAANAANGTDPVEIVVNGDATIDNPKANTTIRTARGATTTVTGTLAATNSFLGEGTTKITGDASLVPANKIETPVILSGASAQISATNTPVTVERGATATMKGDAAEPVTLETGAKLTLATGVTKLPDFQGDVKNATIVVNVNAASEGADAKAKFDDLLVALGGNSSTINASGAGTGTIARTSVKIDKTSSGQLTGFSSQTLSSLLTNGTSYGAIYRINLTNLPDGANIKAVKKTTADADEAMVGALNASGAGVTMPSGASNDGILEVTLVFADNIKSVEFTVTPTAGGAWKIVYTIE